MDIQNLLDILFQDRDFVGTGLVSKYARQNGLSFPENTIKKSALYLNIQGKEIYRAGKVGTVYSRLELEKILSYINNTNINERRTNLNNKFPERLNKLKETQSKNSKAYRQKIRNEFTSINILLQKYHLSSKSIHKIGKILGLTYIKNRGFYNKDVPLIEAYLNSLPSDPIIRSRLLASNTIKDLYGYNSYMQTKEGKDRISKSRKNKCEHLKKQLEYDLNIKLISSQEAQKIVNRNNSTVITTAKLLQLQIYSINGSFYYNKDDIVKMDLFFKAKVGNKGQLARLFELKLVEKGLEYITEKTYPDLRTSQPLRFDYYLPKYNCLIEVQGGQHFHPYAFNINISKEEAFENFKQLQKRDQMKRDYCKEKNIKLIEIITIDDFNKVWDYIK